MSGKGGRSYADMARRVMGAEQPESSGGFSVRGLLGALSSPAQQQTLLGYDPSQGAANNTTRSLLGAYNAVKTQPAPYDPQEFWRRANAGEKQDPRAWETAMAVGTMMAPIKAYHGSPHSFDAFDSSKIGTGEGAQAYGHGLYFAESPGVAQTYRDALSRPAVEINGTKIAPSSGSPEDIALAHIEDAFYNQSSAPWAKAYKSLLNARDMTPETPSMTARNTMDEAINVLAKWQEQGAKPSNTGNMYEVQINAEPHQFLDWDKPLSGQPQAVRDALAAKGIKYDSVAGQQFDDALLSALTGDGSPTLPKQPWNPDGPNIYKTAMRDAVIDAGTGRWDSGGVRAGAPAASAWLKDAGIPGIKYLDQGSRGAGEGSRNYVVFDPKTIEILRKYGLLGPMAGLGLLGNDDGVK